MKERVSGPVGELLSQLGDPVHLQRTRAQYRLAKVLPTADVAEAQATQETVSQLLEAPAWESRQGGFATAKMLVEAKRCDQAFTEKLLAACIAHIADEESRVRAAVGECLGELARSSGLSMYEAVREPLIHSILDNYDRVIDEEKLAKASALFHAKKKQEPEDAPPSASPAAAAAASVVADTAAPAVATSADESADAAPLSPRTSARSLVPDTEGWKCLETSMKTLQHVMSGLGRAFSPMLDDQLFQLLCRSTSHMNRYVREIGFSTLGTVCEVVTSDRLGQLAPDLTTCLAAGLADNWSQVRFASSVATRAFLAAGKRIRRQYYALLLPRMCLNRYYVAEGVRNFSLETWKSTVGDQGKDLLCQFIKETVQYYVEACAADNHAVREAACHCLAELASKIGGAPVRPFIDTIVAALVLCFKDESWPVRDAACTALGNIVLAYPNESRRVINNDVFPLWCEHLSDNIWSVRENSAIALSKYAQAYPEEGPDTVGQVLSDMLPMGKLQPAASQLYGGLDNSTTFGVAAKKVRDNDPDLHTNQQTYSCGSLAPKMRRATGCMDCSTRRRKEPWEHSDGAIYLAAYLSAVAPEEVTPHLDLIADLASLNHFAHWHYLSETVWKNIVVIVRNIGKDAFLPHRTVFDAALKQALDSDNQAVVFAAQHAQAQLNTLLG